MNDTAVTIEKARVPGRVLVWGVAIAWVGIYLLLMAHGGWQWRGPGILGFGMPQTVSLERFGAAVPRLVENGDWQRLALDGLLHRSLLGLLLLLWFWSSIGRRTSALFGTARAWLVFVAGATGGAGAHVLSFPEASYLGGAGPFGGIMGGLGALFLWALCNKGPVARAVLRSVIITLIVIAALTWFFTRDVPDTEGMRAMVGIQAEIGAFGAGVLAMGLLGPRRSNGPAGGVVKALSVGALLAVLAATAIQAPRAWASGQREAARTFLAQLGQTEFEAWQISRNPREATPSDRSDLARRLDAILDHDFIDGHDGESALRAYVDALRAYTSPDVPNPWETEARCRETFRTWFREYEAPLRHETGLPERSRVRHFWESS